MISHHANILSLRLQLLSMTLLILSALLHVKPLYAALLPDSINWLWQTPPDQAQVNLRLTSVDSTGKRQIAEVMLNYSHYDETSKLAAEVKTKGKADRIFCFQCNALYMLNPCDKKDALMPESPEVLIPGTQLPWRILTAGFCRQFKAQKNKKHSDAHNEVFDVLPLEQNNEAPEFKLRVFVSKATKLPEKIAYINALEREVSIINIHEIRNTMWGMVVTRSTYCDLHTQARVLIEVRSGSASAPPDMERR